MNKQIKQDDQNFLKNLTVLYVEDEDDIRSQLTAFLQRRLAKVHSAVNGQDGLDTFSQYSIDLVVTDIRMPIMDGLTMAERIRAMNPKIPIIITTAFEETSYFQQAIDLGVDKYVIKPINLDILNDALLKVARHLRAEAALRELEERYWLLFKFSNIAISIADADISSSDKLGALNMAGQLIDCNESFMKLLGYERREELMMVSFSELLMPRSVSLVHQHILDELLVKDFSREFEIELSHHDGRIVPAIIQLILRRDAAGNAQEIWAILRDLTEEYHSKQALQLAASVFERVGEAILISDANNCIVSVNQAFCRLTGYTQEEVVGKKPSILQSGKQDRFFYRQLWDSLLATGHWQGEIWDRRKNGEVYPGWLSLSLIRDAEGKIINHIGIFSDISRKKEDSQRIEFLAHFDPLTRLANRTLLEDRALQALLAAARNKTPLALMFIDLDRFKVINDSLGHEIGDKVLITTADRLRHTLRETDIVARLGGDEFIVILTNPKTVDDIVTISNKLIAELRQTIVINGHNLVVTPSIGISLYPEDGAEYVILLKNADTAMYNAKKSGRNNFLFYTANMNVDASRHLIMENALRLALINNEFELFYQPQVQIENGRMIGMEALLRWNSAELGWISPGDFIPLAEECGLIISIGEWVLREASRQNAEWQRQGLAAMVVAVNLSALQFGQKNLLAIIRSALQDSGLAPKYLELELTESIVMGDAEFAIETLLHLKKMGLKLSIDDFGTGYSSLSYLKRFAIDKLKIDQSFVFDIAKDKDDESIIKAIIGLAHELNLLVIAEGVETQGQLDFLREHSCDEMQGYLYSKPIPAAEMTALLMRTDVDGQLHA